MKQASITSLPQAPSDERRARRIKYSIAMGIRLLCFIGMLFVRDWWLLVLAAGAIFLPYVAVVIANAQGPGPSVQPLRPGAIVPVKPSSNEPRPDDL